MSKRGIFVVCKERIAIDNPLGVGGTSPSATAFSRIDTNEIMDALRNGVDILEKSDNCFVWKLKVRERAQRGITYTRRRLALYYG